MSILDKIFLLFADYHHKRIINYFVSYELDTLVDVGSHKGEFLKIALKLKSLSKIYCFEPQKKIFLSLKKKFSKYKKISFFNLALDRKKTKKFLYINALTSTTTMSTFNKDSKWLKIKNLLSNSKKNYVEKYKVNTSSLDEILKNKNLKNCLLKIDVEGFEYNVLKGCREKMREIPYILIENQFGGHYKNNNYEIVKKYLYKNNYKILKKFLSPTLHYQDIVFKKKNL